ncbi:MAG: RES family NAD+ phosphorylase [Hyphomicrobiales bacterium]
MKITTISDRALVRLISNTHHKPPVLRGLVDSDAEMDVLAALEGLTSARLTAEQQGTPGLDRRELAFIRRAHDLAVYGQSHINAAFTYTRPTGNRFNTGERGAWYCSYDALTSADEVGFHRTRELSFIGLYEDEALYCELLADFIGEFPDLGDQPDHPALSSNIEIGYPAGQDLAHSLRADGHRGLLYPSVRRQGGRNFVAFDPGIVQNVRPGAKWKLIWNGSPEYALEAM